MSAQNYDPAIAQFVLDNYATLKEFRVLAGDLSNQGSYWFAECGFPMLGSTDAMPFRDCDLSKVDYPTIEDAKRHVEELLLPDYVPMPDRLKVML